MKLKLFLLVAALVVVSAGCLRTEIDIDVSDDGSVQYGGVFAVDPDAIGQLDELFGELGESGEGVPGRDEICDEFVTEQGFDDMPSGEGVDASVEPYDEDGFCGVRFNVTADADAANEALAGFATGGDIILRQEPGGGWYFELPLGDLGDAGDVADFPGFDGFFDGASFVVRVKLPGTQIDHNADEIASDGTMIWNVDLLDPPGTSLFVQTEPGDPITGDADPEGGALGDDGGSNTLLIVLLVILALAAIGAAIWWFSRKKSSGDDTTADQPVGVGAAGFGATAAADEWATNAPSSPPAGASSQPTTPDPTQPFGVPAAAPTPEPTTPQPTPSDQPEVVASPTPAQATGQSVWDPVRRAYVQWDPTAGHWLVFDDATQQWRTEA
ncbi:MAG: hypothetical protein ACE367_22735 [Acidimicrobiales bacterium]